MEILTQRFSMFMRSNICVICDDVGEERSVLVAPAQDISSQTVNTIIAHTGGLTFVALTPERATALMLSPMVRSKLVSSAHIGQASLTQYTSVEAREGVSTGISAADRATTIRLLGAPSPQPRALVKPGHIFPVETRRGGTLVKAALPEAAVDIVTRAGFTDAALFVDLLDSSGEIMASAEVQRWASAHEIPVFSISEIIRERLVQEPLISRLAEALIPTHHAGDVLAIAYRSQIHDMEHVALVKGELKTTEPVLVRVQVEHTVADVFGGNSPATRRQIANSLAAIGQSGSGVLLYLRTRMLHDNPIFQSEPPHGTSRDLRPTAAMREYGVGAQILRNLGITQIKLLSTTQRSLVGLESFGITVTEQVAIPDLTQQLHEEHTQ